MASKTQYVCQNCGSSFPKWSGQCGSCGSWNTLVEEVVEKSVRGNSLDKKIDTKGIIFTLPEVTAQMAQNRRISTGVGELDRVLGGEESMSGFVPGSVILIGGEPGIGKSTILSQLLLELPRESKKSGNQSAVIYVCGEESPMQVARRLTRLSKERGGEPAHLETVVLSHSTDVDVTVRLMYEKKPQLVIVDSIQTLTTTDLTGVTGSVGQIRETTLRLITAAKQLNCAVFLVGHVTKEGELAGPKVLEHMVDAVLELSGDRTGELRLLRTVKNRFGPTDEVGVFQMSEKGMLPVTNPSQIFLEHVDDPVPGSATACVLEGTRPLMVEVQALVVRSFLAVPRRVGRGIDTPRLHIITALLQKYCRMHLDQYDVFVSLAGGYSSKDPALDLAIALALASSLAEKPLPPKHVCLGEVGLLGEIRNVGYYERRIKESKRLGFEHIISKSSYKMITQCVQKLGLVAKKGSER